MEKVSFMSGGFDLTSPSRQVHPKRLVHLVKPPLNIKACADPSIMHSGLKSTEIQH